MHTMAVGGAYTIATQQSVETDAMTVNNSKKYIKSPNIMDCIFCNLYLMSIFVSDKLCVYSAIRVAIVNN